MLAFGSRRLSVARQGDSLLAVCAKTGPFLWVACTIAPCVVAGLASGSTVACIPRLADRSPSGCHWAPWRGTRAKREQTQPPFRASIGTWQLISADDYWNLIELCAPKSIAVIKGWMSSNKISIPDDELMRVRDILAQTAADKKSVTKEDFIDALADRKSVV